MSCRCVELQNCLLDLHVSESLGLEKLMSLLSPFQVPEQIFPYVSSLKDERNAFVKLGKFDEAVQVYTKATSFLALSLPCCVQDFHPLRDLAIPINLNLAMCALKLSKFDWAKRLCDCVLRFEPSNVKALFRRGLAALELGHLYAAKMDLSVAREAEPNNKDIAKEWDRLNQFRGTPLVVPGKCSISVVDMSAHVRLDVPTCLENQPLGFNPLKLPKFSVVKKPNDMESIGSKNIGSDLSEEGITNLVGSKANFQQPVTDPLVSAFVMEDSDLGPKGPVNPNLAEPKRFSNQSRPGSFLTLSPPDYKKLGNGRTLNHFHPRLLSFMSIRAVGPSIVLLLTPEVQDSPSASSTISPASDMEEIHTSPNLHSKPDDGFCSTVFPDQISPVRLVTPKYVSKPRLVRFRGNRTRYSKKAGPRVFAEKVPCTPGMKRKGLSNTFISCYPMWKRRVTFQWYDKVQAATKCDPCSSSSSNHGAIHWTVTVMDTTSTTSPTVEAELLLSSFKF